jgi:hypothetical protein
VREGDVEVVIHGRREKKEDKKEPTVKRVKNEEPAAKKEANPDILEQYMDKNAALQREVIDWFTPVTRLEEDRVRWIKEDFGKLQQIHGSISGIHLKIITHLKEYSDLLRGPRTHDQREELLMCIQVTVNLLVRAEENIRDRK